MLAEARLWFVELAAISVGAFMLATPVRASHGGAQRVDVSVEALTFHTPEVCARSVYRIPGRDAGRG